MRTLVKGLLIALLCGLLPALAFGDAVEEGRRIYQEGILPSGRPLTGVGFGHAPISGREAACITCHRRSGMGSVEGDTQVPPVTGRFLFADQAEKALAAMDRRSGRSMNQRHRPYGEASLMIALRTGIDVQGRQMATLMPRFNLTDSEARALIAYLRQLSAAWSPGVTESSIRFATVITPDLAPERRDALLTTLRAAFAQKNGSTITARAGGRRHMVSAAEMVLGTERHWLLDVWELHGDAATWEAQLAEYYAMAPVFALVSGASGGSWKPIHDFCEARRVPCWFPSAAAPVTTPGDYNLYFSRGVALEADVAARYLHPLHPARLVQILRADEASRFAADALQASLAPMAKEQRIVANDSGELSRALRGLRPDDAVMLWLRPEDLAALAPMSPRSDVTYLFSGALARARLDAIPEPWRRVAHVVYPWEVPTRRQGNMEYFRAWLAIRHLPLTDEALQSEAWFAVDYLSSTVADMLDNLYRDYLIERAEEMLGRSEGAKAEEQTRMVPVGGPLTNRPRAGTSIYPRLSLAPGERFASKGAWIVRFDGKEVLPETEWIVPEGSGAQ